MQSPEFASLPLPSVDIKRKRHDAAGMEDEDRPSFAGDAHFPGLDVGKLGVGRGEGGVAGLLVRESLDSYSQDELVQRITLLEAEILRVKAHHGKAAAHRLAAEALFKPKSGG